MLSLLPTSPNTQRHVVHVLFVFIFYLFYIKFMKQKKQSLNLSKDGQVCSSRDAARDVRGGGELGQFHSTTRPLLEANVATARLEPVDLLGARA